MLRKKEIIELTIEKLAFGGKGLGRLDEYVVFVENTIPGDKVRAKLTKIKKNYAEAVLEEIIEESPLRIKPRCSNFGLCGGCSLQNLDYLKQTEFKAGQVKEAFEHIGRLNDIEIKPIISCEDPWFYRNKMEFSFGFDERSGSDELTLGLHPKGRRYDVFSLNECYLEEEDTPKLVSAFEGFARKNNISPYHFKSNTGLLRSLIIREGKRTGKRLVNLLTSGEDFPYKKEFVGLLTNQAEALGFKTPTSIYITKQIVQKGSRTEFHEELLYGEKHLLETMKLENGSELHFEILPQAFFQTNTLQAEVLYDIVTQMGDVGSSDTVFDLFCGTGTIGLFTAHKAKKVVGIDINKSAIENAQNNAKLNNITNADFIVGDALKVVKEISDNPDIIIVDPPRAGLGEKLCEHLSEIKSKRMIYVSCNPITLARDLAYLCSEGYNLTSVQPVDMFPHTYHIETVCRLDSD